MQYQKIKKLNIWLVHPYGITPNYPASTRTYEFGRELANRGHSVTCWFSSFIHPLKKYVEGSRDRIYTAEDGGKFKIRWLWTSPYKKNNWRRSLNMLIFLVVMFLVGLFSRKPDVIVGSSPHLFGALACSFISKIKRVRFILEVRDLWPESLVAVNGAAYGPSLWILYKIERYLYKTSDHIIVLTEGIKSNLVSRGVPSSKVSFIPNGISLNAENCGSVTISRKDLAAEGKFICMYAGAVAPANALDNVVLAAERLSMYNDIHFVIIGEGQERKRLQEMALERSLSNVAFIGPVPKKDVGSYVTLADICLLTLKKNRVFEGALPNKIFDYLFYNRPVICAVDGEVRQFVEQTGTGVFVPPEDPQKMAEKILELYLNPSLIGSLSKNGKRIVEENFSREKLCNKLVSVLTAGFKS